jgi:AraC-like DNA-binding protein
MDHLYRIPKDDPFFSSSSIEISLQELGVASVLRGNKKIITRVRNQRLRHSHVDELELFYLASGSQLYHVANKGYRLWGGDLVLVFPGEPHGFEPRERSTTYVLMLSLAKLKGRGFLDLPPQEGEELSRRLKSLRQHVFHVGKAFRENMDAVFFLATHERPFRRILIRNLVTEMLIAILNSSSQSTNRDIPTRIHAATDFIAANICDPISSEDVASRVSLSKSHFQKLFRQTFGVPLHEYILRKKVEKAGELLKSTNKTVTEIAYDLNFSSSQYFATVFRQYTGISPSDQRKKDPASPRTPS